MIRKLSAFSHQLSANRKKLSSVSYQLSSNGFTLVELLVTMFIFILAIAAASNIFTAILTQYKQQSKIAEINVEGIIGLEMLRQDIEHAGYGLPWNIPSTVAYNEATTTTYNDCSGSSPCNPPRAILSGNNTGNNSSDYLVIKAVSVARNDVSSKWTTLQSGNVKREWVPCIENVNKKIVSSVCTTDNSIKIIVILPGATTVSRSLVVNSSDNTDWRPDSYTDTANFAPTVVTDTYMIYGVDPDTDLRMPFNRADYYISASNVPDRCASGTGVLEKATINHSDGGLNTVPLFDCVADMQVVFRRDTDDDGTIDTNSEDITALTAQQVREQVKDVRVYILAHEGQIDRTYTYPTSNLPINVGETLGGTYYGSSWNTTGTYDIDNITNWQNYRWKVYRIVVKPTNLE